MKLKKSSMGDGSGLSEAAAMMAIDISGDAVTQMVETGIHPASAVSHLIDALAHYLRSMDRASANVVLKDIAFERYSGAAQMVAMEKLVEGYEAQCDQIAHEEQGGRIN